ncbi:DNA gyrase subunit A [Chitinophaga pendula]|uniref:DNA gyrase subunit A n=1 Tax=Chitinophaga TaxID=79328 RepID=UPI000BB09297|nr:MULTISPECIES: DNA gyrase subunit A [Chitinophaga]ASZ12853.1 DNA gyrase subunit A [Chitinophaga sp. MD30]UCJ09520.1 DNA gyrase subunit A [Chitinophaga pendula]
MTEHTENQQEGRIVQINIEEQMKTAYIDYSMSVIVGRALPDVRDGLKPVHRRVLFGMNELGNNSNKPYKKSARIVGDVMGKYHPHGDSSIYDAIVRLAQPWSMRYPMVDGQGNFGSVDGDMPAAMRYTEIRLQRIAEAMLEDIDKETVDFTLNFDDTLEEPTVLPTRIPNLLLNGASGIAVGMATNIMPHNLSEVVDGAVAYIDNRELSIEDLIKYIKAPDFPTGGIIYGFEGVKQGFETGRGRVVVRGKLNVETTKAGRDKIIIYELPYQINKAVLHQKIAQLVNDKIIEGISDVRDESDREGMRLVIDLKREAIASVVVNQLYKYSELQTSYGINNVALVKGRPRVLNLKELLSEFVDFRHEVVVRRTRYELRKAEEKAHILAGYLIALDHLDEVINLIRSSKTPEEAKEGLMSRFELTEIQSKAILELRLQRLTGMERDKIREEYDEIMKLISHLKDVLADESLRMKIIKDELEEVKKKFGDERKTEIQYLASEMRIEDIIAEEDVVITISHLGYIKRTAAYDYRQQKRGGRGAIGGRTRDEDYIEHLFVASTHHTMLFFTEKGRCYWLKVYEIPDGEKQGKGRAIQNLITIPADDKIRAIIDIKDLGDKEFINNHYIVLCTKNGIIKKTLLEEFSRPRQNGVNAITINEGDQLLEAKLTNGNSEIMMAIKSGRAIRFPENTVRDTGRGAIGVRGIEVDNESDEVVGMICVNKEDESRTVLVVSEKGFGKRTNIEEYRITNRGGKGVKTINVTEKTGSLIGILDVTESNDLMITCKSGITIRMAVADIREAGRATQGVRLIKLDNTDEIAAVARLDEQEEQNQSDEGEEVTSATDIDATTPSDDIATGQDTEITDNNEPEAE